MPKKKIRIDPITIKQAIKSGQLKCYEDKGNIFLADMTEHGQGDTVCILNRKEVSKCQ